jgi:hypothetical protein
MKIGLIDTRTGRPGESLGTLLSMHETMASAFQANDAFQQKVGKHHIVTKIVTIKQDVSVGEIVKPCHLEGEGSK